MYVLQLQDVVYFKAFRVLIHKKVRKLRLKNVLPAFSALRLKRELCCNYESRSWLRSSEGMSAKLELKKRD